MIANQPEPTPGLPLTINFKIPAYWTPEQALAVFELLDDLRDQIGAHYSVQLFELIRQQAPITPKPKSTIKQSHRVLIIEKTGKSQ